ncbi:MAG: D-2-hydroxyacid dehydrogenase [Bacteroidales bacterium]|nr:D-2-hydroxyacid dehydrogenase [Bacteroidales bacterium]
MKIVFLDAETLGDDVSLSPISDLGEYISYPSTRPEQTIERCKGFDVVISNKVYLGKEAIDALLPELKLICVAATGTNNVDMEYAAKCGIPVRNAVNYSTESVAQTTYMFILSLVGRTAFFDNYVKGGEYSASGCFTNARVPFFELSGKKLGIIGLGNIGSRVATIGKAFGMEVSYYPTSGVAHSDEYPALPLEKLLAESDIVSIHCPLNPRTKGLIGYEQLKMMKPSAYIVNMGRGGIIVEEELARALDEGIIAGSAADVFTKEPMPAEHPFLHLKHPERMLLTPHIGWASREARECLIRKIAENISKL